MDGQNINLLDTDREPTDEQFQKLLQSVAKATKVQAEIANKSLMMKLDREVADAWRSHCARS
jgi:hypothetical protein